MAYSGPSPHPHGQVEIKDTMHMGSSDHQSSVQGGAVQTWLLGPDTGLVAVQELGGGDLQARLHDAAPQDLLQRPANLQQAEVQGPATTSVQTQANCNCGLALFLYPFLAWTVMMQREVGTARTCWSAAGGVRAGADPA